MSKLKIGLALGGGGARGFCHLGILKQFEKHKIDIYAIAGTSMGSLVGGLYASGTPLEELYKYSSKVNLFKFSDWNSFKLWNESILKGIKIQNIIKKLARSKTIEECPIKFISTSFDLKTAKVVHITEGDLVDAIYASMAVPAVFRPLAKEDRLLVDGGVAENISHKVLKDIGCDIVISVDALGEYDGDKMDDNILKKLVNIINIQTRLLQEKCRNYSDITLTPKLSGIYNFEFTTKAAKAAIEAGEKCAKLEMDNILSILKNKEREVENV